MKTLNLRHPPWGCKLSQTSFPDVKLTTLDGCGKVVAGHRVLLASVSRKLAGLFNRQEEGVVIVRTVRFSHLETVVNFLYSGSVCVGGEGEFTEEDLQDVLNLLQVNKEGLGEIEDHGNVLQELDDYTELEDSLGGRVSESVDRNVFLEDNNFTPPTTGKIDWRSNENGDADTSELSNNDIDVSAANSIKSVDEDDREDFRRRLNSKQEHPDDDSKAGHDSQKKIKKKMAYDKRSVVVHCTYCLQKVVFPELRSHCRNYHPESPFDVQVKCEECPSGGQPISQVSLQFHMQIYHLQGAEDSSESSPKEIIREEDKVISKSIIKCEFCDKQVRFDEYFQHYRSKHRKHEIQWTEKVECPACKNEKAEGIFVSRACLPLHIKTYHGDQTSDAGEETYGWGLREGMRGLKRAKRIDGRTISCEFCPNKKVRYFLYQKHCKDFHVEVPQERKVCPVCRRSVFVYNFKYHNQFYHPEITPGYLNSVIDVQRQQGGKNRKHEPKLKDEASLNSQCGVLKEGQNISPFRVFFAYKGLMKKSFVCVNYHTKISVLFEKYIRSLKVDMKAMNREQVVFRCIKVDLTGLESVGTFHNKTVEVSFL